MSDNSSIEWTDATWNPVTGCTKVSPGCDHCYAETFAERWRGTPGHHFENGFDITLRPERLGQPIRWKRPRRIFVNSMSDLFHTDVPDEFIAEAFAVMAAAHWHTFQLLTKRHGRMRSLLGDPAFRELVQAESAVLAHEGVDVQTNNPWETWPLPNVWLGVSVEDQKRADLRIPALLDTPAAVRWISAEPLLGPIDLHGQLDQHGHRPRLTYWLDGRPGWGAEQTTGTGLIMQSLTVGPRLDWVVVGGESGPGARPMHPDWARNLRDQCAASGVAFLFKQWGAWGLGARHPEGEQGPGDAFINPNGETGHVWFNEDLGYPTNYAGPWGEASQIVARVGKKAAGRELDGQTWDEFPSTSTAVA